MVKSELPQDRIEKMRAEAGPDGASTVMFKSGPALARERVIHGRHEKFHQGEWRAVDAAS